MKDGWHVISGLDVFVDNNKIIRGTKADHTAYVYRWSSCSNAWVRQDAVTPAAFRAGVKRGSIILA